MERQAEQAFDGGVAQASPVFDDAGRSLVRSFGPVLDLARLTLRLAPGNAQARRLLAQLKAHLEGLSRQAGGFSGPAYELVREVAELLDQDAAAMGLRSGLAGVPDVAASKQDPVLTLYRMRTIDDVELRGASEIRTVAELMADGGIGGVKAMNPMAVRVDGGQSSTDMRTFTKRHHATERVAAFLDGLRASGSSWSVPGAVRPIQAADVFVAIVVGRVSCRQMDRKLVARDRTAANLVRDGLRAYADAAKEAWAREDAADREAERREGSAQAVGGRKARP